MTVNTKYVPGMYVKKRPEASELVERYFWEWEKKKSEPKKETPPTEMPPTICFSRKIGVGALEVADILSEKIGYRVVDREILEHIAEKAKIRDKTVAVFDELYPGKMDEFWSLLLGEKSFTGSDYARHLIRVVYSMAFLQPTIFVGRGAHLILPRDRLLAVRLVSSKQHRVKRLVKILNITEKEASKWIDKTDREQRDFFKTVFSKKNMPVYDFDLVINFDYITAPRWAAEIVAAAFATKFADRHDNGIK